MTAGDVEKNPGPTRNMNVKAQQVTVNRQRRVRKKKPRPSKVEAAIEELDSGRMTRDPERAIPALRAAKTDVGEDSMGWYFKYVDPAGAVESGRAVGECSKIPDGLVRFSVDAEIREVFNESVPGLGEGEVPLDGRLWSVSLISLPMFRTAYFAVANVNDLDLSDDVSYELVKALNNLPNWRAVVDSQAWIPLPTEGWFYKIRPLRPTYDLGDSTEIRTVASWRMTYKSITAETNAPTLLNQGFWVGGHFAQDYVSTDREVGAAVDPLAFGTTTGTLNIQNVSARAVITLTGIPQGGTPQGGSWIRGPSEDHFEWSGVSGRLLYRVPEGMTLSRDGVVAASGSTLVFDVNDPVAGALTVTLMNEASENLFIATLPSGFAADGGIEITTEGDQAPTAASDSSFLVELPPLTTDELVANNPKMEQCLIKDTEGAYLVHAKMRDPVFRLTPAKNFGSLTLDYPGYDKSNTLAGPFGVRDSMDLNFSTGIVVFKGLSHSTTLVAKVYQGWEGVTASHTPFGQFGHSGLPKNEPVLALADDLSSVRLTGVYPAKDNFAATVATLAATLLSKVCSSEATQSMIAGLGSQATAAVQAGVGKLPSMVGSLLGRVADRVRTRRAARRAARGR